MRATTFSASLSLFALCACLGLSGCTLANTAAPTASQTVLLKGAVFGGSLPVVSAHVYLYAANTKAIAGPNVAPTALNSSVSLLKAAANTASDVNGNYYVVTGNNGSFSISGDFNTCTPGEQLYLYSLGGVTAGNSNPSAGFLADIGGCTATYPNSSTVVQVNEMSTVAAAYALAGFASDATHISDDEAVTSNTTASFAQTGMANAFANAANLVTLGSGAPLTTTPGGNGAVPTYTLNTIASLLADCVQSTGITNPACSDLFTFTGTPVTGDTATAAIKLAQNPAGVPGSGITVSSLFNSLPPNVAFLPVLSTAPNDFSIAISFTGTQINFPNAIAIDSQGSAWLADNGTSYISKLNVGTGYADTDYTDYSLEQPLTLAIDTNNNVWVGNSTGNVATEFSGSGTTYTANDYTGGTLNYPDGVAVDGNNNVFYADLVPSGITEFSGSGTTYTGTLYSASASYPQGIAVDASNNIWTGNVTDGSVTEYIYSAGTYTPTQYTDATLNGGAGAAVDAAGSVWFAGSNSNSLTRFAGAAGVYTSTSFTGGGLNDPLSVAVDGSGTVWLANSSGPSISEFSNLGVALSPTTGFTGSSPASNISTNPLAGPTGIAVDGSGNVWVSDASNAAVEFVGAGTPVVVPLASAVHFNKLGVQP